MRVAGTGWSAYYEAAGDEPRDTLLDALRRFDEILQAPIGRDPELLDWVATTPSPPGTVMVVHGEPAEKKYQRNASAPRPGTNIGNGKSGLPSRPRR